MSVTAAAGFSASGVACGIKGEGRADLALVVAEPCVPIAGAGVFTTNKAAAAPVQVSRAHLAASRGQVAGVLLNSGCANAATGQAGRAAAERSAGEVAGLLGVGPESILVCSTGLIGDPLPLDALVSGLPTLVSGRGPTRADALRAAQAILTTDTHEKEVVVEIGGAVIGGMAKGAGMIAPNMATMLCVLTTDAAVSPELLQASLRDAVGETFNQLTVDGCTSTNDTVIALASGRGPALDAGALTDGLTQACGALALALAQDAEGTTRVARIRVVGAASNDDARRAARAVAESNLVKTSLYGGDPYWGRIVSELGASGAAFDLDRVRVLYGDVLACAGGTEAPHDHAAAAAALSGRMVEITCDLGCGSGAGSVITCDLGHGYIDENMKTS